MFWALWAGFVASVLAAAFFGLARSFHITRYSPAMQLGGLVVDDPRLPAAETVGLAAQLLLGSTVVPLLYFSILPLLGGPGWGSGALLGVVHGALAIVLLPWAARVHRGVRAGRIPAPGRWGEGWGTATPVVVLAGSVLYGAVVGAILAAAA